MTTSMADERRDQLEQYLQNGMYLYFLKQLCGNVKVYICPQRLLVYLQNCVTTTVIQSESIVTTPKEILYLLSATSYFSPLPALVFMH